MSETQETPNNPEFAVHLLNEEGKKKAAFIQFTFDNCLNALSTVCINPSREWSLVRTKLEEACFFAKKAMATNLTNQDHSTNA